MLFLPQMVALLSTFLCLILFHSFNIVAFKDQQWMKATATYAKDTEGSLITGTSLSPPLIHLYILLCT